MIDATLANELTHLCNVIQTQQIRRLVETNLDCDANIKGSNTYWEQGQKYVRITIGDSSRYFVRISDGAIFASASWKTPNFKRQYGTLDTVDSFEWGGYNAVAKADSDFIMVNTRGGYQTAVPRPQLSTALQEDGASHE